MVNDQLLFKLYSFLSYYHSDKDAHSSRGFCQIFAQILSQLELSKMRLNRVCPKHWHVVRFYISNYNIQYASRNWSQVSLKASVCKFPGHRCLWQTFVWMYLVSDIVASYCIIFLLNDAWKSISIVHDKHSVLMSWCMHTKWPSHTSSVITVNFVPQGESYKLSVWPKHQILKML